MKKFIATFVLTAMLVVLVPFAANAQTRRNSNNRGYNSRSYNDREYSSRRYDDRNIYDKHRNVINVGAGTGAGALIGALAGGKKGALIGALIGAGGSALYTYKIKPKNKRRY